MSEKILRLSEVIELTGLSRSTIDRLEAADSFPQRRRLGAKAVGWVSSEVVAWIEKLAQKNVHKLSHAQNHGGCDEK